MAVSAAGLVGGDPPYYARALYCQCTDETASEVDLVDPTTLAPCSWVFGMVGESYVNGHSLPGGLARGPCPEVHFRYGFQQNSSLFIHALLCRLYPEIGSPNVILT